MSARIGRLSAGVGRRHPVTIRKASLMAGSMRRVWALRHQTGVQHSAVECTRARVAIRRVVAQASHPEPASRLRSAMSASCEVMQGVGDTWANCPTLLRGICARSRRAPLTLHSWFCCLCYSWCYAPDSVADAIATRPCRCPSWRYATFITDPLWRLSAMNGSVMNVVCYEGSVSNSLLWDERSVMNKSVLNMVCFEKSVMSGLLWTRLF